jgi:hypothetical protein
VKATGAKDCEGDNVWDGGAGGAPGAPGGSGRTGFESAGGCGKIVVFPILSGPGRISRRTRLELEWMPARARALPQALRRGLL